MIRLERVRKVFSVASGDVVAVDGVSLEVAEGETLCLIGTSGSGKTTTMKMVNRMVEPSAGRVLVAGKDVASVDPIKLRRRIGWVIQRGGLFPHMTVGRNVSILGELEGWPEERRRSRAQELLELVSLPPAEFEGRYPRELSGGQRQRVGLARALCLDPAVILMDEPFGALDPITRATLHREFRQLQDRVQKTVLLVTHDLSEAFSLGDRVALMDRGQVVQLGVEADFRQRPASPFVEAFVSAQGV
jgi:osmoprotectant transport system ATP-binding protein